MQVNLYLHKDTFCYNGTDSREDLVNKLNLLTNDLAKIKSTNGSNIVNILVSSDLPITDIYQKENIFNLLKEVSPEAKILFYSIIGNTSEDCDSTIEEINLKSATLLKSQSVAAQTAKNAIFLVWTDFLPCVG